MKWGIQRKQREELAGMSEADMRRVLMSPTTQNPTHATTEAFTRLSLIVR